MKDKRYKLTKADIKELKRLREENPAFWSYAQLARKFETTSANVCYHIKKETMQLELF